MCQVAKSSEKRLKKCLTRKTKENDLHQRWHHKRRHIARGGWRHTARGSSGLTRPVRVASLACRRQVTLSRAGLRRAGVSCVCLLCGRHAHSVRRLPVRADGSFLCVTRRTHRLVLRAVPDGTCALCTHPALVACAQHMGAHAAAHSREIFHAGFFSPVFRFFFFFFF